MNKTSQMTAAEYLESLKPSITKAKKPRKKSEYPEFHKVHVPICNYLRFQYPDIFFNSDTVANVHLTGAQQNRNNQIQDKDYHTPDIEIVEPRGGYHGLFLEVKYETPYLKKGGLSMVEHIQNQNRTLEKLRSKGYVAYFVWDVQQAKEIIDWYLKLPISQSPSVPEPHIRYPE